MPNSIFRDRKKWKQIVATTVHTADSSGLIRNVCICVWLCMRVAVHACAFVCFFVVAYYSHKK